MKKEEGCGILDLVVLSSFEDLLDDFMGHWWMRNRVPLLFWKELEDVFCIK